MRHHQQKSLLPLNSGWRRRWLFHLMGCRCQGWRTMTQCWWKCDPQNKFQTGKCLWGDPWGQSLSLPRIPQREKEAPKGHGLESLGGGGGGGCVSQFIVDKDALMCFPAGRHRNARPCSLLQPLGIYKHPSPKGRSISFRIHHKGKVYR